MSLVDSFGIMSSLTFVRYDNKVEQCIKVTETENIQFLISTSYLLI